MSLGDLQHMVMLAVIRLGDGAYGAAVRDELRRVGGRNVTVPTVYVTLVRLEEQGLVSSRDAAPREGRAGRPRRVFHVTAEGWEALDAARSEMSRMWDGVVRP